MYCILHLNWLLLLLGEKPREMFMYSEKVIDDLKMKYIMVYYC
jgi:hypothetical protein